MHRPARPDFLQSLCLSRPRFSRAHHGTSPPRLGEVARGNTLVGTLQPGELGFFQPCFTEVQVGLPEIFEVGELSRGQFFQLAMPLDDAALSPGFFSVMNARRKRGELLQQILPRRLALAELDGGTRGKRI